MENILKKYRVLIEEKIDTIQTIVIALVALLVPAFVPQGLQKIFGVQSAIASNSQYIVGSIVNLVLVMAGTNLSKKRDILLISMLPSISAIGSGYIFGSLTKVTIYMIPGIWLGNLSLIMLIKYLYTIKKLNYVISAVVAIIVKVAIIYGVLNMWMHFSVLPNTGAVTNTLKYSMGLVQLITATVGTIAAFPLINTKNSK